MGDVDYRSEAEQKQWRERDPVTQFADALTEADVLTADDLDAIDDRAASTVEEAVEFMEDSEMPSAEEATTHMYQNEDDADVSLTRYR